MAFNKRYPAKKNKRKQRQEFRSEKLQFRISDLKPRSNVQKDLIRSIHENELVFAIGPAGTGKTHIAVHLACSLIASNNISKIYIVRPAVEAGEHLGFLKGDLNQKMDPYFRPIFDIVNDICERPEMFMKMHVEIAPLAYMRGRTLKDCFIILDEAQNTTPQQMKMFLTRLGPNSKTVVTGDIEQSDLGDNNGLKAACDRLRGIDSIDFVRFESKNVIRTSLVRKIVDNW